MQEKLPYDLSFYSKRSAYALQSARIVVPLIIHIIQVRSVVDVGCGRGEWLLVFKENDVERIFGLDGEHVDPSSLLIPAEYFRPIDLRRPFGLEEKFDLAICLEVAEHLPKRSAKGFVESLTQLAPVVLFSAAIPLQGEVHHINEQWPEYWQRLFRQYGYKRLDPVRKLIWKNEKVLWWYRQNMFIFAREDVVEAHPVLCEEAQAMNDLMLIHPSVLQRNLRLGPMFKRLPRLFTEAIQRKIKKHLRIRRKEREV